MSKECCDIILDLLPGYIDGILLENTKKFVENHLDECKECRYALEIMKKNISSNDENIKKDDEIELRRIKKERAKIRFHKLVIIVCSSILAMIIIAFLFRTFFYMSFSKKCYDALNSFNTSDNYVYKELTMYRNYSENETFSCLSEIYYKDGKYKRIIYSGLTNDSNIESITLGSIGSNEKTLIFPQRQKVEKRINSSIYYQKGQLLTNNFIDNHCIPELRFFNIVNNIRTEEFTGKKCYVYSVKNENGYTEYWIEKDSLLNIRTVESYSKYYREILYTYEEKKATDEDVNYNYSDSNFEYTELETNDFTLNINDINSYVNEIK